MLQKEKPTMTITLFLIRLRIAILLVQRYSLYLQKRMPKEFITEFLHEAPKSIKFFNGRVLSMVNQKISTQEKNKVLENMKEVCVSIRGRVRKSKSSSAEMKHAFAVSTTMGSSMKSVLQIAEVIQHAYRKNREWANSIGIVDADIDELQEGMNTIYEIKQNQEEHKLSRQLETITKDAMQCSLEKKMCDISEIGYLVFKKENPSLAKLFRSIVKLDRVPENLKDAADNLPSENSGNKEDNNTEKKDEQGNSTISDN